MKFLLVIFLVINPITDLDKVAKVNKAKKEAEQAYSAEDYALANAKYLYLKDSLGVNDEKLLLNLANTQYILQDSTGALNSYSDLKDSPDKAISSIAHQQLGAMQFNNKKYKEALNHYKSALKENPTNTDARYNYELLKKILKEQEEQQQQKDDKNKEEQNEDQEKKDQEKQDQEKQDKENKEDQEKQDQEEEQQDQEKQDQEKKDEEQEKKDQEEQNPDEQKKDEEQESKPSPIDEEKLKEMKISEEKAKLILEAMKNNEVQYIQQNKRKAKKKKDPSKPDW